MNGPTSTVDAIVALASELRSALIDTANGVTPNNLASDDATTVQAALLDLRAALDAFLERDGPDSEITGELSTE